MSCDIHLHVEIKIKGKWEHYAHPDVSQDYKLFEKMAGVHGNVARAISPPRGLPKDISVVTRFDAESWPTDWHSHSWLNADEIVLLSDWLKKRKMHLEAAVLRCWLFGNSFAGFTLYRKDRRKGLEDLRFVFWFDN